MSSLRDTVQDLTGETAEFDAVTEEQPAPSSMLTALRARAHELAAETTLDLAVPGYGGVLVARYQAVAINAAYSDSASRGAKNPINDWGVAADTLARALEGLYGRNAAGALEPLAFDGPTRYDDELVEMLGLEPEAHTARAVLVAVCGGGELGRSRVWSHFMDYQGWLLAVDETPAQEVASQTVGEYRGR